MKKKRNYGGRPEMSERLRKNKYIRVRVSEKDELTLNRLYSSSNYESLSELVRAVLLKEPINVKVRNIELSEVIQTFISINAQWFSLLKSKREEYIDLKPIIEDVHQEVKELSTQIRQMQSSFLTLNDIEIDQPKDKYWTKN